MPKVHDVLKHGELGIATAGADETVYDAVKIMADRDIGSVIVWSDDEFVGIFTERDVMNRVIAKRRDPATTTVRDVMTSPVICCQPDTQIAECKSIMADKKLRHLPVVDGGDLIGMVTVGDILEFEAQEQSHTIQYMHEYLQGTR